MQDYNLDNIFMYGAWAKDIVRWWPGYYCHFDDVTHQETPENLYRYVQANCLYNYNQSNTKDYEFTANRARQNAKKSKFPLPIFLGILGLGLILFIALLIHNKSDFSIRSVILSIFGILIILGLPFGISMLIRGAIIRDNKSFKQVARAVSSEVYVTKNEIIVFVNGQDYPNYSQKLNMVGQFMPYEKLQYIRNNNVTDLLELEKIEREYNSSLDKPFLFNQAFVIRSVDDIEVNTKDNIINITCACDIYLHARPPIGIRTYSNDVPADHVILSKYFRYVHGFRTKVTVSVPYIKDIYFMDSLNKMKGI